MPIVRAYIGLGANVGDAPTTLAWAVRRLAEMPGVRVRGVSRLYATRPVGVEDQPAFHNAVVAVDLRVPSDAAAGAGTLLERLKEIEQEAGRSRRRRWGPRELDLDLLVYGRHVIREPRTDASQSADPARPGVQWLEVPHPTAIDRAFVLAPLADLAPGLVPPGWGATVARALRRRLTVEGPDAVSVVGSWAAETGGWSLAHHRVVGTGDGRQPREARMPEGPDLERWVAIDERLGSLLRLDDPALTAALADSEAAGLPRIAVSPLLGQLLHLVARLAGARRILEVGTLGGYSTICLARALPADGRLVSLEIDPRHARVAQRNIERAGLLGRVAIRIGPAAESLAVLDAEGVEPFDLVFIDADKRSNPDYLAAALRLTRPGSLIVVDNVVRRLVDGDPRDPDVLGTLRVLEHMGADPRLAVTALQTVGTKGHDGFAMALVLPTP